MLFPTATLFRDTIEVPLYAVTDTKDGTTHLYAAAFFLPLGSWTVVWNVITMGMDAASEPFTFDATAGVQLRLAPLNALDILWQKQLSPTQWALRLENYAQEIATMSYEVTLDQPGGLVLHPFDPSVVVTPDPIEPPT